MLDLTPGAFAAGPLEQASIGVTMIWNAGTDQLVTDGETANFASMADLFRDAAIWAPLDRKVCASDILTVTFRNFQPAAGGHVLVPSLVFAFKRDAITLG